MVTNFPNFSLPWECLHFSFIFEIYLHKYRILDWQFLSSHTWKTFCHFPLTSLVSKKSYHSKGFTHTDKKSFFILPSTSRSLRFFCVCGFLYSNLVWGLTRFLEPTDIYGWPNLRRWEVFRSFPSFFSGLLSFSSPFMTEITNAIFSVIIPHIPEALLVVSFPSAFFLLFRLGNFYCCFFQFINVSSVPSILVLSPSTEFLSLLLHFSTL